MLKNVSGQRIGTQMVSATDGTAFTGAVTVYVTGDAGTQGVGSVGAGACTHEGNGYHTYAPAQAETNYDLIAFTFIGTGAIPATVQTNTEFSLVTSSITAIVTAVWAQVIGGARTALQTMRGFSAVLLGKASGLGGVSAVYRDPEDTKDVLAATVDADGNRTAITTDLT